MFLKKRQCIKYDFNAYAIFVKENFNNSNVSPFNERTVDVTRI